MLADLPPSESINALLAFVLSAALLWTGASIESTARQAAKTGSQPLQWLNALLIALALWWPAYQGFHAAVPGQSWTWLLTVVALLGVACGLASQHGARAHALDGQQLAGVVATLVASVLAMSAMHAVPGEGRALGVAAPLFLALPLAVGLRLLHMPLDKPSQQHAAKAGGAVMAAACLTAVSHRVPPLGDQVLLDQTIVPVLAAIAMGAWAGLALRQMPRASAVTSPQGLDSSLDPLTGLRSRSALEQSLAALVAERKSSQKPFAVMVVNLDGFKPVNATYGHAVGDEVIKHVGRRLRDLAGDQAVVSRLSSDEYVLLVKEKISEENALKVAQRVADRVAQPIRLSTREVSLTCCVGVAMFPTHGDADRLLARADTAMHAAKHVGAGRVSFFSSKMERDAADDFELLGDFRKALDNNELVLYYQPKVDAASGQVTAAEALLRWTHPQRGNIGPSVFVPMAERFGLIAKLGDWVIENACRQSRLWSDRGLNMRVAINISAQHMRQPDLGARIANALSRYRIDPTRLTCEITESLAMENTQATQETFAQLAQMGVHVSIDDFGTGYSSLAYLRKLPASEIKIDRSFVMDLERSADARSVIDAVVKLAHALGKRVVAEGVENVRQRRVLTELGCDELQGFLFAHPMPADDLLQWALDDRNRDEQVFRSSLYVQPSAELQAEIQSLRKPIVH
jgi:diguanylate cyclase